MSHSPALLSKIRVQPVTSTIGAEISGLSLESAPDSETKSCLVKLLHRWRVLFFRDQRINDEQFLAFGRIFGVLTPAHPIAPAMPEYPEIWERSIIPSGPSPTVNPTSPITKPLRDVQGWHIDISFMANPNRYSILRAVAMPAIGGDTLWSNLAQAYAGLSSPIRTMLDGLTAVHRIGDYDGNCGSSGEGKPKSGSFAAEHPLVRIHPGTGEKILFFNPGVVSHIVGLKERESQALIDLLTGEITRSEYTVRFRWSRDALVMWDNQATAHTGPIGSNLMESARTVRRITISGDLPLGPTGIRSRPLSGEQFGTIQ